MLLITLCTEAARTRSLIGIEQVEDDHLIMLPDVIVMRLKQGRTFED